MLKHTAVLAVLVLAGCGGESPEAQQAEMVTPSAPAPLASPSVIGCWQNTDASGTYDLTLGADGALAYAGVKSTGKPIGYTATWSTNAGQLTISAPNWSIVDGYSVDASNAALTIVQAGSPSVVYQRVACL